VLTGTVSLLRTPVIAGKHSSLTLNGE